MSDISEYRDRPERRKSKNEPDYESQLAINVYRKLKTLGFGTLRRLQGLIELVPLTKTISEEELRGLDILDSDD